MVAILVGSPQFSDTPPIPGREPTTLRSVKTLVLGPDDREHAIVKALRADPLVSEVRCAPGNAGIAKEVPVYPIDVSSPQLVVELCQESQPDRVVVGPEALRAHPPGSTPGIVQGVCQRSDACRRRPDRPGT